MNSNNIGDELRDVALEQVTRPAWMAEAVATFYAHRLTTLPKVFTGEDIREMVLLYMRPPHHHNAWGALTMNLVRNKMIEATGTVRKMSTPSSHSRRTFEYRLGTE
jgi:hypothetical protein